MKIQGVPQVYSSGELLIEQNGSLLELSAGSGHETGTVYLTPAQARFAAAWLVELALAAERDVQIQPDPGVLPGG